MKSTKHSNFSLILILGALTALCPFSIDMYLSAFPKMAESFHTNVAEVSLSLSSFFVGLAAGQLFYGPLLDRFGRKSLFILVLSFYILATIGCLTADSVQTLVVFRFIQAVGGCAANVAAMAMVRDFFSPKRKCESIFFIDVDFRSFSSARSYCRRISKFLFWLAVDLRNTCCDWFFDVGA